MSEKLEAAAAKLREQLDGADLAGTLKFEVTDLGAIRVEDGAVTLDDSEADCTISADEDTFTAMMEGDLDPTSAFMTGKLKIDGDMSIAMGLASSLG
ncbi:SCP2 sterol-binding domain-containing protein [Rhodovulum sp. DZ06]|uniref:SCP2 sterol-binding domain-containing protein n=1 Tax=Rhodovulum sp. DZ06 TaxID=3425126 RepID=UPI003D32A9A2